MKLSKEQEVAAKSFKGPHLVIATPGAGKTTILLERIKNLIEKGVSPQKILTITFSKAAATELKDRFSFLCPNLLDSPHFYTIHAFSYIILRDFARRKGIEYKLLEGSKDYNKYSLLSKFYLQVHKSYISDEKLENLVNKIGYVKNMMLRPIDISPEIDKFEEIFNLYDAFKKKYKYIDFDDMLELGLNILKTETGIRKKYTDMYDFIQIDEGQDTSKLQMEIVKLLTKKNRNLFVVADDDQSIYSFRGADPQGLFDLQNFFPELKIHYMETNYRCSKNIVTAADSFIDQNQLRFKKKLKSSKDFNQPVEVIKVTNPFHQYRYLLDAIKDEKLEDVGVLFRNNISALGLIEFLEKNNVPFVIGDSSKIKFRSHRIAKDLLDILKFSEDVSRTDLLENFYYKINGYISKLMIEDLKKSGKRGNAIFNLSCQKNLKSYSIKLLEKLDHNFKLLKKLPFDEKLDFIYSELGYEKYLKFSSKKEGFGLHSELLVFSVLRLISRSSKDLELFEGRLAYLDSLVYKSRQNSNGINLSTIHSAKGKEYKLVFIIDVYEGMFPAKQLKNALSKEVEEERRLFYVAMTRAKEKLTIIYPAKVGNEETEISEFLIELETACK